MDKYCLEVNPIPLEFTPWEDSLYFALTECTLKRVRAIKGHVSDSLCSEGKQELPSMKKLKINLKWFKIINAQKYFWNWFFRSFGKTFVQTKGEGRESLLTKFAQNFFQTNGVIFVGNLLGINDLKSFRLDLKFSLEWYSVSHHIIWRPMKPDVRRHRASKPSRPS